MRRIAFLAFFIILLISLDMGKQYGQEQKRILVDEYHTAWKPHEKLINLFGELEGDGYIVRYSENPIDSILLSKYDALALFVPSRYFHEDEREAIRNFVENGGGLILFGDHRGYMEEMDIATSINSVSLMFGIEFNQDVVLDSEKNREGEECHPIISTFASHPVTRDVESAAYICGCSLKLRYPATALAFGNSATTAGEKNGRDVVVLAVSKYGKGRVVAVGDTDFLVGPDILGYEESYLSLMDNKRLAMNIFEWCASIRMLANEADELVSEGNDLFSQKEYLQAKSRFEKALEIYTETTDEPKVAEMQKMISKCNKALDAEAAYQKGLDYLNREEYTSALAEFERCTLLYTEVGGNTGASDAQLMIETCYKALKRRDAEGAYGMGEEYYNEGSYESALAEFEKSKSLYSELGDSDRSSEAQLKIDACNKASNAEAAYRDGIEYYNSGKYELAISKFEEAISLYRELGNDAKAQELESKKEEAQEAMESSERRNRMLGAFGILVAVACSFLAVFLFLRKSGTQERPEILYPDVVYCASCGMENVRGALFCKYCKTPLKPSDELEKEKILKDMRRKLDEGEITEEEFHKLVKDLKENL